MNHHEFQGRICFVAGGASGIGHATARAFASRGAIAIVGDVVDCPDFPSLLMDVRNEGEVRSAIDGLMELHGQLDFAVNCAGIEGVRAETAEYPARIWDDVLAVNLTGVFYCMQQELRVMLPNRRGAIVNVSSVAGITGFARHAAYTASKHGVIGLTKAAAVEYAHSGIRVNAVCPAYTLTPMVARVLGTREGLEQRLLERIPVGRFASAAEIAESIVYVCSEAAGFMTGHSLVLDGGITAE